MQTEELRESFPVAKKPVKNNENTDVHKCVLCETVLSSKLDLQEHFRKHGNGSIDSKGRPVTNKTPPTNTVSSTVKSKNITTVHCDVCTAQFETVTQAIHHKYKQHPNSQLNHFCKFCGKQFPLEVCKDMHIRAEHSTTQKSNKIYKCRLCSVDFYSAKAVQAHVQSSHKSISQILTPIATLPPCKKIKMNNSGEPSSVYYCHLCGNEYIVKFNLQKHLEQHHRAEDRDKPADQLVKCMLCDALFYNKKAYDNHNLHHSPDDLYLDSELDRKTAVSRVDCDFDLTRVPTMWEKIHGQKKPRVKRIQPIEPYNLVMLTSESASPTNPSTSSINSSVSSSVLEVVPSEESVEEKMGRNRAMVDSDSECKSDTSDESDQETNESKPTTTEPKEKRRKINQVKLKSAKIN